MIMLLFALSMVTAMSIASVILMIEESANRQEVRSDPFARREPRRR